MRQAPSAKPTDPQSELINTFPNDINLLELIQNPEDSMIINAITVKK